MKGQDRPIVDQAFLSVAWHVQRYAHPNSQGIVYILHKYPSKLIKRLE